MGLIEIGTNSTKYLTASKLNGQIIFDNENSVTGRLGEGLIQNQNLSEAAIKRNLLIIQKIMIYFKELKTDKVFIIATQAMRMAKNYQVFKDKVISMFDINIKILTPEQEAFYSFYGQDEENCLMIDIGGGSTEIIYETSKKQILSESIPVGAVFLKEQIMHDIFEFSTIADFLKVIYANIEKFNDINNIFINKNISQNFLGIGGTFTSLISIKKSLDDFNLTMIDKSMINYSEIITILERLRITERHKIRGLSADRYDIIPFGISILLFFMDKFSVNEVKVSCKGVRHGFLAVENIWE